MASQHECQLVVQGIGMTAVLLLDRFHHLLHHSHRVGLSRRCSHNGEAAAAKGCDVEAQCPNVVEHACKQCRIAGREFEQLREEESLRGSVVLLHLLHVSFVEDADVGTPLVHHHQTRLHSGQYVLAFELEVLAADFLVLLEKRRSKGRGAGGKRIVVGMLCP